MTVTLQKTITDIKELKKDMIVSFVYDGGSNPNTERTVTITNIYPEYNNIEGKLASGEYKQYKFILMSNINVMNLNVIEQDFQKSRQQVLLHFREKVNNATGDELASLMKQLPDVNTATFNAVTGNLSISKVCQSKTYVLNFDLKHEIEMEIETDNIEKFVRNLEKFSIAKLLNMYDDKIVKRYPKHINSYDIDYKLKTDNSENFSKDDNETKLKLTVLC